MSIQGRRKTELTIDSILEKLTPYDIYREFMPTKDWKLNEVTFSPFKVEKHPSFLIGNKYGHLTHVAFNNTALRGDCFAFVKQLLNLSTLDDILRVIDNRFGLGLSGGQIKDYKTIISSYKQPDSIKRNNLIQVITRPFLKEELQYWNKYSIDISELREAGIYSIKSLYLNKSKFPLKDTELRFGYYYEPGFWKTYRPYGSKKEKWMPNNVPITAMDGKESIKNCDVAFINKSRKDHLVIKKVFKCSCAIQNEGVGCFSEENVQYLKNNSKKQILSFDADVVGVENSQQITKLFDFDYCNVPKKYLQKGQKDWSDVAETCGIKEIEKILREKQLI